MKRECETRIKRKTPYCPPSMECMATDDMPYYQNRIMLLEENKQLKEELVSANESITWWNNRFNVVTRDNEQLKNKIKELVKYGYGTDMSLGEFKEFYKLGTGKDYDPKKCPEVE